MNIIIIGGAGYIGTRLTQNLIEAGHDVTVCDAGWFGWLHLDSRAKKIRKKTLEITKEDFSSYEVVVFLAGLSNDPMADFDPAGNFIQNGAAPAYLAYVAKKAGVKRFVYASSCSVYGFTDNQEMKEDSLPKPQYPYGIAKLQAEQAIMMLEDDNFRPISLRKGTVGGWSPRMRFDLVVNTMIKYALTKGKIVVNNPNLWRPLVDIRDVVQAYEKSITASTKITGIFNISYKNYTIKDIAKEIKQEMQRHGYKIAIETKNIHDVRNYKATNVKAIELLNYKPKYSVADSVREILQNLDLENIDFEDKKYYNIKIFKELKNDD